MEELEAKIRLTPPKERGRPPKIEDVISTLEKEGIVYGVDEAVIKYAILKKEYNKFIVVAKAKLPTKGQDASYIYKYEGQIPAINGQILAIKEPPTLGEPGISVFGREIPGILGTDFQIIAGKNTYLSGDGKILYSTSDGKVFWKENRVDVLKVLRIDGDLAEDIDFDGIVIVSGNILEGVSVKAEDVKVGGDIRKGVSIVSKGTIEVENDIVGSEEKRVKIKVECDCLANSASYCDCEVEGSIIMKTGLLHSNTKAEDAVVIGRKGIIMSSKDTLPEIFSLPIAMAKGVSGIVGGTIQTKGSVSAEIIGSISQEKTEITTDVGGFVSVSSSIYPKTKITIGKTSLEIKKAMDSLTLKEERGGILQFPYQQKEVRLKTKEYKQKKPESLPSILVRNIEDGKRFLGIIDVDYIPLENWFLCFERQKRGAWEEIKKEKEEEKRKEEEKDGEIEILNQEDGLFVVIKPPGIKGKEATLEDTKEKLKEFYDYDENILKIAIEKKEAKPVKIGNRQYIEDIDGKVIIRTKENKEAYITLTPPHSNSGRPIRGRVILREIEKNNITYGIDKKVLASLLKNPIYNKEILFAKAKMPTKGANALYLYKFEEEIPAIEGQILAIKEPPKTGEKGIGIFGDEIEGLLGDDFEIIPGSNTYLSEDKRTLCSTKEGKAIWSNNRCDVERILVIEESCKEDVKFDGRIVVLKDIVDGVSIEGNEVFIKGNIGKGVFIVSNGGVEIEGDITGDEKERIKIKAERDVMANSASYCDIESNGSIIMKTGLLHSNTRAEDAVVIGRKGVIMTSKDTLPEIFSLPIAMAKGVSGIVGGMTYGKFSVRGEIIGSVSYEKTEIMTDVGGFVSASSSIYPKTKITIGKAIFEVKKIMEGLTLKEERGGIIQSPYQQKEVRLKPKECEQKKPESPPSILVRNIDDGKRFLGIIDIDYIQLDKGFLCFEMEKRGAWEKIREERQEERRKMEERDGEIEILNQEDGLFVVIKPSGIRGRPVTLEDAKEKLKEFYDWNENILRIAIEESSSKPERIANRQYIENLDGKVIIRTNENKEAYIALTPSHPNSGRPIRGRVILREIEKNNITYGIDKKVLTTFIKNPVYNKEILFAKAKLPTKGENAYLAYQFGVIENKEIKKEDCLEVIEGQILAIKELAKRGEPGVDIFGNEIEGIAGDDIEIAHGTGTYLSQDRRILYSNERGEAIWKENRCNVEKVLRIEGNCGEDIDFPGKVIISGNVEKRTTIVAKGDIVVRGMVEMGARLICDGTIYIDKNVVGKKDEDVFLKAGGDIVCESCEMANIEADGILVVRVFLDGNVRAKKVFVQGRRGIIMTKGEVPPPIFTLPVVIAKGKKTFEGGKIFAEELVDTEEMGSSEMAETEIEVGENGIVSISGTIFPNSKIKIGKPTLRITKPLMGLTFKLKDGRIKESPYESFPIEMTKKEIPLKKMKFEPPASIVITDHNLLDAISKGAHFLKIPEEKVEFSLLLEEKPNKTIRVYPNAMFGPWSEDWDATYGEDKDSSFSFDNRADGLYFVIYPPHGEGKWITFNDVLQEIKREGFGEIDYSAINNLFKEIEEKKEKKEKAIKIGPRQYLSDVSKIIKIKITEDEKAEAIFYPPMIGGMLIDMDEVMKFINKKGIVVGIDDNAIKNALVNEKFKEPILIASPILPIDGKDAFLEYKVKEKEGIELSFDEDGRVNFKETSSIVSVKKGDVLVEKHPSIPGKPGKKITGEEILPIPVKDVSLPSGKNTKISDDGLFLIADIDGRVIFKEKKVDIEPLYEVKGDVCLQTGNIHFAGNVAIFGSVQQGFIVEAEANIFIKDTVDGGIVNGGGRVEIQGGIRKGDVRGKAVSASFIENSFISSDDVVVKEGILHSNVLSDNIKAKKIIGGKVSAAQTVTADEIGKDTGINTFIYMGRKKEVMLEIDGLAKRFKEEKKMYERLLLDIAHIDRLSLDKKEFLKKEVEKKKEILEEIVKRIKELENMEKNEKALVLVKNKVYPEVYVNILQGKFLVLEEKGASTFKLSKGRVVVE